MEKRMTNPDEGRVSNLKRTKSIAFLSNLPWQRADGVFSSDPAIAVNATPEMSKELLRQHISNVTGGTYVEGNITANAFWITGKET